MSETKSVMRFKVQDFDTVPQGQYIAVFKDVQQTSHEQYGLGVMFVFEIVTGEHKGQRAVRIGKPEATTRNITGKMLAGILGRPIEAGEEPDLHPFVGKPYNILVEPAQGDKTRIAQVWPYKMEQTMPAANLTPPDQFAHFPEAGHDISPF